MRLRPQSELGWLMLQWLAVLVLGHNVQKDPGLLETEQPVPRTVLYPGETWDKNGAVTPEALRMLATTGTVVIDTQPPPEWLPPLDHCQVCSGPASTERPVVIVRDGMGRPWAEHVGDCPRDS
jgi:hypothetical protein